MIRRPDRIDVSVSRPNRIAVLFSGTNRDDILVSRTNRIDVLVWQVVTQAMMSAGDCLVLNGLYEGVRG